METEKNLSTQSEINTLVSKAVICLNEYANFTQEQIDYIVAKASVAALDQHGNLAKLAIEETHRGGKALRGAGHCAGAGCVRARGRAPDGRRVRGHVGHRASGGAQGAGGAG